MPDRYNAPQILLQAQNQPVLTERFQQGNKPAYEAETINFGSGPWYLADALVANSSGDTRVGTKDIRIRNTGKLSTPNDEIITPNWMNYVCTVREIEKATGMDLFSALPKDLQGRLETGRYKGGI